MPRRHKKKNKKHQVNINQLKTPELRRIVVYKIKNKLTSEYLLGLKDVTNQTDEEFISVQLKTNVWCISSSDLEINILHVYTKYNEAKQFLKQKLSTHGKQPLCFNSKCTVSSNFVFKLIDTENRFTADKNIEDKFINTTQIIKKKTNLNKFYNTPEWKQKSKEIKIRDKYRCTVCNNMDNLQVHHSCYIGIRKPWEYDNYLLTTLCTKCHWNFHKHLKFKVYTENEFKEFILLCEENIRKNI